MPFDPPSGFAAGYECFHFAQGRRTSVQDVRLIKGRVEESRGVLVCLGCLKSRLVRLAPH